MGTGKASKSWRRGDHIMKKGGVEIRKEGGEAIEVSGVYISKPLPKGVTGGKEKRWGNWRSHEEVSIREGGSRENRVNSFVAMRTFLWEKRSLERRESDKIHFGRGKEKPQRREIPSKWGE